MLPSKVVCALSPCTRHLCWAENRLRSSKACAASGPEASCRLNCAERLQVHKHSIHGVGRSAAGDVRMPPVQGKRGIRPPYLAVACVRIPYADGAVCMPRRYVGSRGACSQLCDFCRCLSLRSLWGHQKHCLHLASRMMCWPHLKQFPNNLSWQLMPSCPTMYTLTHQKFMRRAEMASLHLEPQVYTRKSLQAGSICAGIYLPKSPGEGSRGLHSHLQLLWQACHCGQHLVQSLMSQHQMIC